MSQTRRAFVDGSDPKSDPSLATHTTYVISDTHTTNRMSTQKLFINTTIQAVIQPITPLVTAEVDIAQESFSPRQTYRAGNLYRRSEEITRPVRSG